MGNYVQHLQELSTSRTLMRKQDYVDYNLRKYLNEVGYKKLKALEVGPGLGEFESYLNEKRIFDIDIIDNDKSILKYVAEKYRIKNKYLTNDVLLVDRKLGKYNFIFLMQVLEHVPKEKYHKLLKMLYSHIELRGFLVIVVPNANNPLGLIERYGDLQHTGSFTEQSLKDLINLSGIKNYEIEIKGYEIPPYDFINLIRIILQKVLHAFLLAIMIVNGGIYFKTMTPNIMLVIRKNS